MSTRRLVHRDLKPANIFLIDKLGMPETVKIIDFGIAKGVTAEGSSFAQSGSYMLIRPTDRPELEDVHRTLSSLIGTPGFMAPEQIRGSATDARTDQYAIGCILYQMLTGTLVFGAATPQDLLLLHLLERPEPPRHRLPELAITNALEDAVLRLLAKEPEDRYPSLHELESELVAELMLLESEQQSQISFRSSLSSQNSLRTGSQSQSSYQSASTEMPIPVQPAERSLRAWLLGGVLGATIVGLGVTAFWLPRQPPVITQPQISTEELQRLRERALSVLSEQARHPDPQIRHGAVETLGQSQDAQALTVLQGRYKEGTDAEQAAALEAMGQLGERQAVPLLQAALRDAPHRAVQQAAAAALMRLGEDSGVQFLEQELTSDDPKDQLHAARRLCDRGHPLGTQRLGALLDMAPQDEVLAGLFCQARAEKSDARERLLTWLADGTAADRQLQAAARLNQLGDPAGRALLTTLAQKPGPRQLLAARLLVTPYQPAGVELFRAVLRSRLAKPAERQLAVEGLGAYGQPDALALLEPLLGAKTPPLLRQRAAGATLRVVRLDLRMSATQSLSWARAAVGDTNWLVRYSAVPLIAESEAADSLALLTQALGDPQPEVRQRASLALGKQKDVEALRSLATMLRMPDGSLRQAAAQALLRVADNTRQQPTLRADANDWFRELLQSGSPAEKVVARDGLLRLGDASQGSELGKLARSPLAEIRRLVAESGTDDRALLGGLLTDADAAVRGAAAQRLADLGDRRSVPVLKDAMKPGGSAAVRAYGALLRLGEGAHAPAALENLASVDQIGLRMALIEEAADLPRLESVALLLQAARDRDPFVRRLAAELAAELSDGGLGSPLIEVLVRLSQDPMALVRTRAETLLLRRLRSAELAKGPRPSDAKR